MIGIGIEITTGIDEESVDTRLSIDEAYLSGGRTIRVDGQSSLRMPTAV